MADELLNNKRQEIIERLKYIKSEYDRCSDVKPDVAYRGSEWSISDLLRHTRGSYRGMAARILDEEDPNLNPGGYDSDESWSRARNSLLDEIESYIKKEAEEFSNFCCLLYKELPQLFERLKNGREV